MPRYWAIMGVCGGWVGVAADIRASLASHPHAPDLAAWRGCVASAGGAPPAGRRPGQYPSLLIESFTTRDLITAALDIVGPIYSTGAFGHRKHTSRSLKLIKSGCRSMKEPVLPRGFFGANSAYPECASSGFWPLKNGCRSVFRFYFRITISCQLNACEMCV